VGITDVSLQQSYLIFDVFDLDNNDHLTFKEFQKIMNPDADVSFPKKTDK
jgi:hypothetical protein